MEEPMSEELQVTWRTLPQMPARTGWILIETAATTLRKVTFSELKDGDWVIVYPGAWGLDSIVVERASIKRWAYETEQSMAELDKFAADMVVDTLKNEVERLEKRVAGARYELEKDKAPATAEVELAIHNALRYLSGEIEREGRP
jgi:hypothetical protein